MQNMPVKRPFQLMNEEDPTRPSNGLIVRKPFWPPPQQMICGYCLKPRHIENNCRRVNGMCLACGFGNYSLGVYPFKRTWNTTPAPLALPVPSQRRNPEHVSRRAPLPPQQWRARVRADRGRGQAYNLSAEETEAFDVLVEGQEAQYSEQKPWRCHCDRYPQPFVSWAGNLSYPSHIIILSSLTLISFVFTSLQKFWGRNFC